MEVKKKLKKNGGFSMIAVILALAFIGMLVFAVLYLALVNFRMKQSDMKAKNSFYAAEKALDEIRAGLQEKEGDALSSAYIQVLEAYASTTVENSLEIRKAKFNSTFVDVLVGSLAGKSSSGGKDKSIYNLSMLEGFIKKDSLGMGKGEKIALATVSGSTMISSTKDGVLLKGLQVTHIDAKGRAAVIRTDIRLKVPDVNFTQSSNMPDLMNMTVVAQDGMTIEGTSSIKGTLYAGKHPDMAITNTGNTENYGIYLAEKASLTLEGERAVTNGTVYVAPYATLKCGKSTSLWARNIQAVSSNVELLGKAYVADDLTIDTQIGARTNGGQGFLQGSTVKLSGEYTGFGSQESLTKSQDVIKSFYKDWTSSALESAVIVNGKDTSLDMSDLDKLMLAGNSYIGTKKTNMDKTTGSDDIFTGESITVKGNQLAYLVPAECLFVQSGQIEKYGNPMKYSEYEAAIAAKIPEVDLTVPVSKLGGKSLSNFGVTGVKKAFRAETQTVSFYMEFDTEAQASAYFQAYYGDTVRKTELEKSLKFYTDEKNGIRINTPDKYLRYITNGNTFSYQSETGGTLVTPQSGTGTSSPQDEQANYQNVYYALNKKMITNFGGLKDGTGKNSDGTKDRNELDVKNYVFDNMVNLDKMTTYIKSYDDKSGPGGIYQFQTASTSQRAFLVDTTSSGFTNADNVFHITKELAEGKQPLRMVICNGPVIVDKDVHFRGVILTNSTLTLKDGAVIESAPEDVPRVIQSKYRDGVESTNEEMRPMDFLWDNTQYIINGAASGGNAGSTKNMLDLNKLVVYENWEKR